MSGKAPQPRADTSRSLGSGGAHSAAWACSAVWVLWVHHSAWRVQQGEWGFSLACQGWVFECLSQKLLQFENSGFYRVWVATGQPSTLRTTGKLGNGEHPALLLPRAAHGSFQGTLLEPANRLLLLSFCHSCGRIWLDWR